MKIRCDRKTFVDRLGLVAGIAASRSTRPILQHVLIVAEENSLKLVATDLELFLCCEFPLLECEEAGSLTLPAARLLAIAREAQGESLDVQTDGPVALIRCGKGQFRLSGEPPADFPELPVAENDFLEIPADLFRELAERSEFAASRELGRYAINGVLLEFEGQAVRFVSTDGRRLARAEGEMTTDVGPLQREIIPLKGLTQFLKAAGPGTEVFQVALGNRRTFLKAADTLLVATSVEADFPDYRAVVDVERGSTVQLEKDEFFACVRQAAVMAGEDARAITLRFEEGSLVITSAMEGLGDARSEMAVDYAGTPVEVSFNPDYLTDFSKVTLPEQIPLQFKDASVSALFQPAENFMYVVMPISA